MSTDDIIRIHERLDEQGKQLAEISGAVQRMDERMASCMEKIESHERCIKGNGKDGLETDVAVLKKAVKTQPNTISISAVKQLLTSLAVLVGAIAGALWMVN